uniref:Calmodulin n=1 Tax=Arcella intermedia TaxID=1963864 RepID=A0A6B2LMB8_9EUKA
MSDRDGDNSLNEEEFILMMHLINAKRSGQEVPNVLPEVVMQTYKSQTSYINWQDPWVVQPSERQRYCELFDGIDVSGSGKISGGSARELFVKSGLPMNTLAAIWNLADINKDGQLDKLEFCVAMHLINQYRLKNMAIPSELPSVVIDSLKADNNSTRTNPYF